MPKITISFELPELLAESFEKQFGKGDVNFESPIRCDTDEKFMLLHTVVKTLKSQTKEDRLLFGSLLS